MISVYQVQHFGNLSLKKTSAEKLAGIVPYLGLQLTNLMQETWWLCTEEFQRLHTLQQLVLEREFIIIIDFSLAIL